jgi:DNA-binding protein H-NS
MADWRDLDLSRLSLTDLRQLEARLLRELADRQAAGRRWLREHGLVEKPRRLYRNPHNAAETWSGHGQRPAWVEQALAEGRTLESLAEVMDPDLPARSRRA